MTNLKNFQVPILLGILIVGLWYVDWFVPPSGKDPTFQVGIVYWPILYNTSDAVSQLNQIYQDGFRLWAMDIPDSPVKGGQSEQTLNQCLDLARGLGMTTVLRLPDPIETNQSLYDQFLSEYAGRWDYFFVFPEIQRFTDQGHSVSWVQTEFNEWTAEIERYVSQPKVVCSFVASEVVSNPIGTSSLVAAVNQNVTTWGLSCYEQNAPVALSMPSAYKLLKAMVNGKPVWLSETGSSDGNWTVAQLALGKQNGMQVGIIWCWETFWGDTEFNIRNSPNEQIIGNYLHTLE